MTARLRRALARALVRAAAREPWEKQPWEGQPLAERVDKVRDQLIEQGYETETATAAAEAIEVCRDLGVLFDRVELWEDHGRAAWHVFFEETTAGGTYVHMRLPLHYATRLAQERVGNLN